MRQRKSRDNPELREHLVIAQALHWWQHEDFWWAHYPSGEHRHGADATKLKCMGVCAGVADFMFLRRDWKGRIVFTEYKPEKGGRLSKAQKEFQALCKAFDIAYAVCRGKQQMCRQLRLVGAFQPEHEREAIEWIMNTESISAGRMERKAAAWSYAPTSARRSTRPTSTGCATAARIRCWCCRPGRARATCRPR